MSSSLTDPANFEDDEFDEAAILKWAIETGGLPVFSAEPFARWLDGAWNDFGEGDGVVTNEDVLKGALATWKGEA